MKKTLIGCFIVLVGVIGIVAIMQCVPISLLSGWITPSESLLATLRQAGSAIFFGISACFLILNLVITAIENIVNKSKSR